MIPIVYKVDLVDVARFVNEFFQHFGIENHAMAIAEEHTTGHIAIAKPMDATLHKTLVQAVDEYGQQMSGEFVTHKIPNPN